MVHASVLTGSMAGEEQLVFHDFLGITCQTGESIKNAEPKVLDEPLKLARMQAMERGEEAVKSVSTSTGHFEDFPPSVVVSEQLSWAQGSVGALPAGSLPAFQKSEAIMRQGKRRDISSNVEFLPQQPVVGVDVPETSPHLKVSRFERLDDRKMRNVEAGRESTMQPPRMSSNLQSSHPSFVVKPGLHMAMSSRWENSKHLALNNCTLGPTQTVFNLQSDKLALNNIRENSAMVAGPPADEGSRTGLRGSSARILLNSPPTNLVPGTMATHTLPSLGRSKSWSQSAGSESMYVASQQTTTPTSRQLTIFYGGQAHVFDDVPSDKADAIMTLAGSSGRSWSTMYAPCTKASMTDLGSEVPHSIADGENSSISKASAMDCTGQIASKSPRVTSHSAARTSLNREGNTSSL